MHMVTIQVVMVDPQGRCKVHITVERILTLLVLTQHSLCIQTHRMRPHTP